MRNFFLVITVLFFTTCAKKGEDLDIKTSLLGTWEGVYHRATIGGTGALVQVYSEDGTIVESFNDGLGWRGTFTVSGDSVLLKTAYYVNEFYYSTVTVNGNTLKGVRRDGTNKTVVGTYTLHKK